MNKAILHLVFMDNNKNTQTVIESFMYEDNNDCIDKSMQIIERESKKYNGYGVTFSNLIK